MLKEFYQSILPPDARIAGYKLERFTLWHEAQLQAIESPLLQLEGEITAPDLLAALKVCGSTWPAPAVFRLSLVDRFKLWVLLFNQHRLHAAALVFLQFRAAHLVRPQMRSVSRGGGSTRQLTAPLILALVAYFVRCGTSLAEIWNQSPGMVSHLHASAQEWEGNAPGFDDSDEYEQEHREVEDMTEAEIEAQIRRDLPPELAEHQLALRRAGFTEWAHADDEAGGMN